MKEIIVALLLLVPLAANAQLSDEMLAILALEEPAKSEALDARREEIANTLGSVEKDRFDRFSCNKLRDSAPDRLISTVERFRERFRGTVIDQAGMGEFLYFLECENNTSAFEQNTYYIKFDHTGISPLTKYMIAEMGLLLKEQGSRGLTPTEFVSERIRAANDNNNQDLAITYNQIRITIQARLMELESGQ